jgi:hypothetical protein
VGYEKLGDWEGRLKTPEYFEARNIKSGVLTSTTIILAGGTNSQIRSQNFVTGTSGWVIRGDGSAEFQGTVILGAATIISADLYSSNWDGTTPANLATVDTGATTGYYLDHSVGSAQFEGSLFVGGDIILDKDGTTNTWISLEGASDLIKWSKTGATVSTIQGAFADRGVDYDTNFILLWATAENAFTSGATLKMESSTDATTNTDAFTFSDIFGGGVTDKHDSIVRIDGGANVDLMRFGAKGADLSKLDHLGRFLIPDGTAGAPGLAFMDDDGNGIHRVSADTWAFDAGGVKRMTLDTVRLDLDTGGNLDFLTLPVKTTTGHPSGAQEGDLYVNTFSNDVWCYADGVWRALASW